jgi:diadenosine tetraphosphate (Ap4A) HIT family hydrolase
MDMADIPIKKAEALNATMRKFGAPGTCIHHYRHWTVLLRPAQVTLGSLVLAAFEPARALSDLSRESFAELRDVVGDIELALRRAFDYDKINYLLLMMVDPDVHFHVIPRYASDREFAGVRFTDRGWPGVPTLSAANEVSTETLERIRGHIQTCWN